MLLLLQGMSSVYRNAISLIQGNYHGGGSDDLSSSVRRQYKGADGSKLLSGIALEAKFLS